MHTTTPPTIQPPPGRNSWASRNWKWLLISGIVGAILLLLVFVGLIVTLVFSAMKSSDAYKIPVATAKADERVIAAIGSPVEAGLFVSGSIHVSGPSGGAELAIPISGSKGKATLYVTGNKSAGAWNFSNLVVEVTATRERINLSTNSGASLLPALKP